MDVESFLEAGGLAWLNSFDSKLSGQLPQAI